MKRIFYLSLLALITLTSCERNDMPLKSGKVSFVIVQYSPSETMELSDGKVNFKDRYTWAYEDSNPYLELYSNWAKVTYTSTKDDNSSQHSICVSLPRIYGFNWKKTEQDAAANP